MYIALLYIQHSTVYVSTMYSPLLCTASYYGDITPALGVIPSTACPGQRGEWTSEGMYVCMYTYRRYRSSREWIDKRDMYIGTSTYVGDQVSTSVFFLRSHAHMCVCRAAVWWLHIEYACMYLCMYVCMYVCMYMYMYMYMYVYVNIKKLISWNSKGMVICMNKL